jgi:hypothetical protein|nr:MAG TPA: hypothetical protein [Caudoviricetes sp.]
MTVVAFFDLALLATLELCDVGYGITPHTVIDEGVLPMSDYTWFEAFSEGGCATGIACTPAAHMQKTIDERSEK